MYLYETRGEGDLSIGLFGKEKENGYAVGKKWMNVHIEMWKKDIQQGILFRFELEKDYPKWFIGEFTPPLKTAGLPVQTAAHSKQVLRHDNWLSP